MGDSRADIAGFYRLALDARLITVDAPIAWADAQIAASDEPPDTQIMDLSLAQREPVRHVIDALCAIGAAPTTQSIRMFAGMLYQMVAGGLMTEAQAAKHLYRLHAFQTADDVLGVVICCIDEYFDPYMPVDDGPAAVREILEPHAEVELPPLSFTCR